MLARDGYPEKGDFVIGTVKKVLDFGAFVRLDEYKDREGLIHISEVASGWIKNIRDHVKEGQKVVCKVLNVDPRKGHIDLSLKDVNEHQKRSKIQEWKNEQKANKWLEMAGEELGLDDREIEKIGKKLMKKFDTLYAAFEEAAVEGYGVITKEGFDEKIAKELEKIAKENVKLPYVKIDGYLELTSTASDGIEIIRNALLKGKNIKLDGIESDIHYVGSPRYRITVKAGDYKKAENALKKIATTVLKEIKSRGGKGEFFRKVAQ